MENFNVENKMAVLQYTDEQGALQVEVKWQLTDDITTFDYLKVKQLMIMSLEGRFEVEVKPEPAPQIIQQPTPHKYQTTIQHTNPYQQPTEQPVQQQAANVDWTKMILDLVEGKEPGAGTNFANKNAFYKYLDRTYGNGSFQSAPKLNQMSDADKKTLYLNIKI